MNPHPRLCIRARHRSTPLEVGGRVRTRDAAHHAKRNSGGGGGGEPPADGKSCCLVARAAPTRGVSGLCAALMLRLSVRVVARGSPAPCGSGDSRDQ